MANERLDRFTKLLKEIFELDKSDLDFGIYRVMNLRKTQIEEFLTQRLPQMVQETLAPFAQGSKKEIRAQMAEIETNAAQFGMDVASLPENNPHCSTLTYPSSFGSSFATMPLSNRWFP